MLYTFNVLNLKQSIKSWNSIKKLLEAIEFNQETWLKQ